MQRLGVSTTMTAAKVERGQSILDAAVRTVLDSPEQVELADQHWEMVLQAIVSLRG